MIKINIIVQDKYSHRFGGWMGVQGELQDLGFEIGRDLAVADFDMVQTQLAEEILERNGGRFPKPVIIYERSGSASLHPERWREYLRQPEVLGYAKETGFRDDSTYNAPHLRGRFHHTLMSSEPGATPQPILSEADLAKVSCIFQIYAQDRFDEVRFRRGGKWRHRPTDVFFAGAVEYDVDLVTEHRRNCCAKLLALQGRDALIGAGRALAPATFHTALRETRIFVSPYGYGEYSWKDYEAIYSGCVLVKPACDFVISHGFDIYSSHVNYIPCKPDFSDLEEVIERVASDVKGSADLAAAAAGRLEAAAREKEQRAKDIATFLTASIARVPA